ncbi:MAG TPA: hypothetical protein VFH18_08360 [Erysipelotrichaceae bacterium]|nr:hypothetical protein [Erysipelotrichaceae bacterium]
MTRNKKGELVFDNLLEERLYNEKRRQFLIKSDAINAAEYMKERYELVAKTQQVDTNIYINANDQKSNIDPRDFELLKKAFLELDAKQNKLATAMIKLRGK